MQIKRLLADGKSTQKTIGSQFNVSRSTVRDTKSGRRDGVTSVLLLTKKMQLIEETMKQGNLGYTWVTINL